VGHHRPGVLSDVEHRAFQMDVPVDETGGQVLSGQVQHFSGLTIISHPGDMFTADGHVSGLNFAGEGIDHTGVGQDQVGRTLSSRHRDQIGQLACHQSSSSM
jgi:hypothetical protein